MQFSDFFGFEKLVTPVVIKIVYWIGIVAGVVFGIGGFFVSIFQGSLTGGLMALVAMVLGLLLWRVMCELYIVIFGMFDRMGQIRDELARQQGGLPPRA
jgi:hypothetical protein